MATVDKNQAIVDFLKTCPKIKNSPLFFNFGDVKDGEQGVVCDAEAADRCGIDGNLPQVRASRGVEGVQVVAAPGIECDH